MNRRFGLGSETRFVEAIFEAFNLFNRLNYASVNNTVDCSASVLRPSCVNKGGVLVLAPPFNLEGRRDRQPSEPLGFTSIDLLGGFKDEL